MKLFKITESGVSLYESTTEEIATKISNSELNLSVSAQKDFWNAHGNEFQNVIISIKKEYTNIISYIRPNGYYSKTANFKKEIIPNKVYLYTLNGSKETILISLDDFACRTFGKHHRHIPAEFDQQIRIWGINKTAKGLRATSWSMLAEKQNYLEDQFGKNWLYQQMC